MVSPKHDSLKAASILKLYTPERYCPSFFQGGISDKNALGTLESSFYFELISKNSGKNSLLGKTFDPV